MTPSPLVVELVADVVVVGGIPKFSSIQYESPTIRTQPEPTDGLYVSNWAKVMPFFVAKAAQVSVLATTTQFEQSVMVLVGAVVGGGTK